jgi:NAD/NADP transhydrogenase alpha subunit
MVGAIVVASALIFGALAGGVIVHRLDTTSSVSSEQEQSAGTNEKSQKTQEKGEKSDQGNGRATKKKNATKGQNNSSTQGEHEDK